MSNKHDKLCFHDTEEVLETEIEAFEEKYGSLEDEKNMKIWDSMYHQWADKEMEILKEIAEKDPVKLFSESMDVTVEDEKGNIWICMKMFNINRLWKIFGTEP